MARDWMRQLNEAQQEAVRHEGGPLLVVAGAGTGKTLTVASRVARLIERGVAPQRVLLLTFTRRAAREMLARASHLVEGGHTGRVWGGTFHAVGNRLLRLFGRGLGVQPDFTVMDQADAADLMNLIRGELGLGGRDRRFPRKEALAAIYSRAVNGRVHLAEVLETAFPWCRDEIEGIRSILRAYGSRKRKQNLLDYDDLLLYWRALATDPTAGRRLMETFDHILVDEYQDTNALQADILWHMRGPTGNVTVVGDDAQAIYSFRSATVRNILEFSARFPGTHIVRLEKNYRSTPPIVAASNAVIALSAERHDKTLWPDRPGAVRPVLTTCMDETEQSDAVCRHVLVHREQGTPLRRQAVLFRAAHHSDLLEVELARRNIPFVKYGGLKFLEAAHVKDVLALLRILENPFDEVSWFRVLQLIEGVGPAGARRLMDALEVRREDPAAPSPVRRLIDEPPDGPLPAGHQLAELGSALADCSAPDLPTAIQIERLRRFLAPVFDRLYSSPRERIRDLEQLESLASRYPSRGRFVIELTLDPPISTGDLAGPPLLDEDYLVLSTIHSAKGLEWDVVHIIHAADGMIPSDMATGRPEQIEEERRLLYVAMTRARDALYVYFPLRYYHRPKGLVDNHSYAQLSRFLPDPVLSLFERRGPERLDDGAEMERAPIGQVDDVESFLASLWE